MANKLDATAVARLNISNEAHRIPAVGTLLGGIGSYVVVEADTNASKVMIEASASGLNGITGWLVNANRSGSTVTSNMKVSGLSGSKITITSGSQPGYSLVQGDLISYFIIT